MVIASKPDGSPRVCVDYRALNQITIKDAHSLPRIDESFTQFNGAKYFTSLDLKSGYWQIPLAEEAKEKTAFTSRYDHYQWNVLPFGLSNASAAFQRRMNSILAPYIDEFVIVYLDDILIFSKTAEEHIGHVKAVLQALNDVDMILNIDKCKFFETEVRFLGHIVSTQGIRPDPRNVEKIMNWPTPRTITDVRGFNNLVAHYKRYIPRLSSMALPLSDLQKGSPAKGSPITWTEREERAFLALKQVLTTEPVLRHAKINEPFVIDPDSSQYCIGAVLQQYFTDHDGKSRLHPIAYESKKLTETEQRYSSQERELLAAKYALDHWRHIIEGSEIQIRTDHESLRVYRTKKPMTKRLARFMGDIEHYNPLFVYRSGSLQVVPDALSRIPGTKEEGLPADTERFTALDHGTPSASMNRAPRTLFTTPEHESSSGDMKNAPPPHTATPIKTTSQYDDIRKYLEYKENTDLKELSKDYSLRDNELWHRNVQVLDKEQKVLDAIQATHKDLGHYGTETTMEAVKQRYEVASDLREKGKNVLKGCIPCQLYKPTPPQNAQNTATIHPYGVKNPFQLWEIDFVGKLVTTPRGKEYLITAIDYATSKAIAKALRQRSTQAAIELLEEIIWSYGKPSEIITDNGAEFLSDEFTATCQKYGITTKHTSPGHPQTNGKVERLNHELIQRLQRISAEENHQLEDWDLYLPQALFAFHAHVNKRMGASPFYLQYGTEPVLPSTPAPTPVTKLDITTAVETRRNRVKNLNKHRTDAAKKYQAALERLASARDDSNFETPIVLGDLVMRQPINRKSKLHPKWDGPFVVLGSTSSDIYQLGTANGYVLNNLVNVARLRKLTLQEQEQYTGEFWEASNRVKTQDARAKQQQQLHDIDLRLRNATLEHLEAQKQGKPVSLDEHTKISTERTALKQTLEARDNTAKKRARKPSWKLRE